MVYLLGPGTPGQWSQLEKWRPNLLASCFKGKSTPPPPAFAPVGGGGSGGGGGGSGGGGGG